MEVKCSVLVPSQYAVPNREVASRDAANSEMQFCGSQLYSIWRKTKIVFIPTSWWSECAGCVPEWMSVHDPGTRLHHAVPVPQQLSQIPILPARHPDLLGNDPPAGSVGSVGRRAIRLLLAYWRRADRGRISHPRLKLRLGHESFELASVPAGFHSESHLLTRQNRNVSASSRCTGRFPGTNLIQETRICVSSRGDSWSLRCGWGQIVLELPDSAREILAALSTEVARISEDAKKGPAQFARNVQNAEELVQHLTQEILTTSYLLHRSTLDESGISSAPCWYAHGLAGRSRVSD